MIDAILRIASEVVIGLVEYVGVTVIRKLGVCAAWLASFGRWDVDDESWTAVILGWCVFVAGIVAVSVWRWHH